VIARDRVIKKPENLPLINTRNGVRIGTSWDHILQPI
jgi:hypothetical protein